MTAALALLAVAVALWPDPGRLVGARLRTLGWRCRRERRMRTPLLRDGPVRRWVLAATAAVLVGLLVGGAAGVASTVVVLLVSERGLRRLRDAGPATGQLLVELPVACDLLAVCLSAGIPLAAALTAVGGALSGPLGDELARVAGMCRLGADPTRAWLGAPPVLEPLARTLRRSEASGARAVPALNALATEVRASARAATDAAVRRAGVRVLAPLGLCFLPAFVCLGVVPLVIGISGDVLG